MAVTAKFIADFTSFYDGVAKAESELRGFETETNNAASQLNRMGGALSSSTTVAEAKKIDQAITDVGTASQQTVTDLKQIGTISTDAAQALSTVGQGVSDNLKHVSDSGKEASATLKEITGIGKDIAAAFGIGFGVTELVAFGKALFEDASQLTHLSAQTGLTLQALQKFRQVGGEAGNSVDEITAAIVKMEEKLAGGDKNAIKALKDMGISVEDFMRLSPENKFIALSDAIRKVADSGTQLHDALEVGGKQMVAVVPTLQQGFEDIKNKAVGASDETVYAMSKTASQFDTLMLKAKGFASEFIVTFETAWKGGFTPLGAYVQDAQKQLADLQAQIDRMVQHIPAPTLPTEAPLKVPGIDSAEVKEAEKEYDEFASKLKEHLARVKEAVDHVSEAEHGYGAVLQSLSPITQQRIKQLLDMKVSEEDIALALGKSVNQVKAVAEATRVHTELAKIDAETTKATVQVLQSLGTVTNTEVEGLKRSDAARQSLHSTRVLDLSTITATTPAVEAMTQAEREHLDVMIKIDALERAAALDPLSGIERVGTRIATLTEAQREGLVAYNKELEKTKINFDTAGAAVATFAQAGGAAFGGIVGQITGLSGQIANVASAFRDAGAAAREFGPDSVQAAQAAATATTSLVSLLTGGLSILTSWYAQTTAQQAALAQQLGEFKVSAADAFNAATDALGSYSQALIDAVRNAKTLGDAQQALKDLQKTTQLAQEASQKYGPSADDLITAYKRAQDIYNLMRQTGTYTADQIRKALDDLNAAEARAMGRVATKGGDIVTDAERAAAATQDLIDQAAAAGYQTQKSLQDSADQAARLYQYMRDSGEYTATQVADAFDKAQKAQEAALGQDSKAIDDLKAKYKTLSDAVSQEAPEEVMGVIETQMRGQMAALDAQIKAAQASTAATVNQSVDDMTNQQRQKTNELGVDMTNIYLDTAQTSAKGFAASADRMKVDFTDSANEAADNVKRAFNFSIHIPIVWDVPNLPEAPHIPVVPMASGGVGYAPGPMLFATRGNEYFAFSGEGKTFSGGLESDVLLRILTAREEMHVATLRRAIRDAQMGIV